MSLGESAAITLDLELDVSHYHPSTADRLSFDSRNYELVFGPAGTHLALQLNSDDGTATLSGRAVGRRNLLREDRPEEPFFAEDGFYSLNATVTGLTRPLSYNDGGTRGPGVNWYEANGGQITITNPRGIETSIPLGLGYAYDFAFAEYVDKSYLLRADFYAGSSNDRRGTPFIGILQARGWNLKADQPAGSSVPEPSSLLLLGAATGHFVRRGKRRRISHHDGAA
jgi:hypothetical protein